jgi:hypothetical protein
MRLWDSWECGLRVGSLLALAGACSMIGCSQSATEGGNGGSSNEVRVTFFRSGQFDAEG